MLFVADNRCVLHLETVLKRALSLRAVNKNHELKEARNSLELKMKKKKIVLKKNLAPNLVLYWHVIENGKQGLVKVICVSFHPQ